MSVSRVMVVLLGDSRNDRLYIALFWGIVVTFTAMVIAAWLQVISRYLVSFPLGWTEELARVMMFWFAYLSIGALVRWRRLMMVDAFVTLMRPRWRIGINGVNAIIAAAALAWLGFLGVELMGVASGQTSPALQIPYSLIYLSLPIGLGGAVLYLVAIGIADLRRAMNPSDPDAYTTGRQAND